MMLKGSIPMKGKVDDMTVGILIVEDMLMPRLN
jgi:hypothetical protein